ncbi:TonB family protein [Methylobacterium sp. J-026]|uniref:energy transducer TonB family protein n=1 Tax=Methylobacterium sp. J-026 TaxID=2836624 RepID=UPI001FBBB693|nr:TonB family protein [Methylobacterium sp. J-026]MCJ2134991.1 TonB family protein [Methylobacterium sp. J-026]
MPPTAQGRIHPDRRRALQAEERSRRRALAAGWGAAALLVVGLHVGGAFLLTRARIPDPARADEMGAIVIDLAPEIRQAASQVDAAVAKPEEQAEPTMPEPAPPEETVEPVPKVADAPVEAVAPLPQHREKAKPAERKPVTRKPPERTPHVVRKVGLRTASAPRSEQHAAATAAAAAGAANSLSAADWKSLVSAALNRNKRFPSGVALSGSPTLRVGIAASGQVTAAAVIASSGSPELDAAAVQTVHRASPLPPPPAGPQTLTFRMNFRPR